MIPEPVQFPYFRLVKKRLNMQFSSLQQILILLLLTSTLSAQEKDKSKWTPSDIINTEFMSSIEISPDNKMVVWTKRKGLKEKDKFVSDIYLTKLDVIKDGKPLTLQMTLRIKHIRSGVFRNPAHPIVGAGINRRCFRMGTRSN